MCYEFERLYWQKRAEEFRQEIAQAEEKKKWSENTAPAKSAEPEPEIPEPDSPETRVHRAWSRARRGEGEAQKTVTRKTCDRNFR